MSSNTMYSMVPLVELILIPTGIGAYFDLGYTDERTPAVPRFVEIMVFVGSEAMCSSSYVLKSSPTRQSTSWNFN